MYSREEVKAITDKVIDMAKADAVEVEFNGGERSATRFANSNITANMVQFDRSVAITVHVGNKSGTATVRDFDDATLKQAVADALKRAGEARESQDAPVLLGPQEYEPIDAALPSGVNYGPAERAKAVRQSLDICAKKGVLGSGYIPKVYQTTCSANSKGLFAYYQYAEASFILTARTKDGGGSGWAGITGVKDTSLIDPVQLTETAADKALKSQKARALEPGRYTVILEPRPAARFLSLMLGLFTARTAEGAVGNYFSGKERGTTKVGEKLFSEQFTLKSDIGNPILRQSPIGADGQPARDVTWVEKGVLKNLYYDRQWATRQKKEIDAGLDEQQPGDGRLGHVDRRHDQEHAPRAAGHVLLVHPAGRSADAAQHRHDPRRPVPHRKRRDRRAGAELPLEHVADRRLQQPDGRRQARADSHRRGVRRAGHGTGAAGPDRRLLYDVGFAGGLNYVPRGT